MTARILRDTNFDKLLPRATTVSYCDRCDFERSVEIPLQFSVAYEVNRIRFARWLPSNLKLVPE